MDMQKQIKTVMAKTLVELDVNKNKVDKLIEYVFSPVKKKDADLYRMYTDIGVTMCKIYKLDQMMLEQQYHANKVSFVDFIAFPIVALLKVLNIFKK